ncbi:hypothetical protein M8J76_013828 [Diaphorina citri]|nr:hypothetical protein M8J75_009626 [Diaphorina citri]KAI5733612.1 hypothetical protein M8J76_013828 [Diaphorina citri]KAI5738595.1 hypothetical protein M8J77_008945 [Diaphorina citri]
MISVARCVLIVFIVTSLLLTFVYTTGCPDQDTSSNNGHRTRASRCGGNSTDPCGLGRHYDRRLQRCVVYESEEIGDRRV